MMCLDLANDECPKGIAGGAGNEVTLARSHTGACSWHQLGTGSESLPHKAHWLSTAGANLTQYGCAIGAVIESAGIGDGDFTADDGMGDGGVTEDEGIAGAGDTADDGIADGGVTADDGIGGGAVTADEGIGVGDVTADEKEDVPIPGIPLRFWALIT